MRIRGEQVKRVIKDQQKRDDDALRDLDAIYTSQDVDAVRTEYAEGGHVHVVKYANIEQFAANVGLEEGRQDDGGDAEVDEVDYEERDGGEGGDEELMSPANVEEVVADAEEGDALEGDDCRQKGCELCTCQYGHSFPCLTLSLSLSLPVCLSFFLHSCARLCVYVTYLAMRKLVQ